MNDNRNYYYGVKSQTVREEYKVIVDWIKDGRSVIDLGCGDGSLLQLLETKKVTAVGMDTSASGVRAALAKGVKARVGRIDRKLAFKNKQFDYAICNVTLPMVLYPGVLLSEMKRISSLQIISVPNFAFIVNRLELLFLGRMPQFMLSGYKWYNTGFIHQLSLKDFREYCRKNNLTILRYKSIFPWPLKLFPSYLQELLPDWLATLGVFMTK